MVSAEEKRKFIEQMIRTENISMANVDIKRQLYEMLNKDTNNGRLYKYRAFDKEGYALKNLKDGTLHCSKPSVFNDPFDCKIGMTFQGLLDAKFGAGIKSIKTMLEKILFSCS